MDDDKDQTEEIDAFEMRCWKRGTFRRKHQTTMDTGIKQADRGLNIFWTCDEKETWDGEWCDACEN